MKKIMFALLAILPTYVIAQADQRGIARVDRIDGIEAYVMSEPLNNYEVVFDVGTGLKASSILTGGLANEGVSDKAAQFVKRAIKEAKDNNQNFDAIIYSSGKRIVAVKFKDTNAEYKLLARVQKIEGLEVYVLSEPLLPYEVVNSKKGGMKMKSLLTAGMVNNSIEDDITKFVQKLLDDAKDDNLKIDAVVYGAGKRASGVKFKE